jgi:crotonobetainyl-CoA:carnitine CoA-transferase CaiB-like acyl-CoA transferase
MSSGTLEGLSVLELGRMVAAPYCGKLLADLGAEVIKVEEPCVGDPARRVGPFPDDVPHPERSGLFLYLNTSKRSLSLDLHAEAGREILRRLVADADVLIEDRAPGELERLDLGFSQLQALNPRLVVTSITPFGTTGPHRDYRTYPLNRYHASAQTSYSYTAEDEAERPPPRGGGYVGDYDAGLTAAVGTLAAILGRRSSGRGQRVEVSQQEAMMCMERVDIGRLTNTRNPEPWRGAVGGMLRAKDGFFMIVPVQNHQWEGLIRAMGDPEWAGGDWSRDEAARQQHRDEIRERIEEWAAGLSRDEIYHRLQSEGTPVGPVRNVAEVRAWNQARERGYFAELDHPEAGEQTYPTAPYLFSNSKASLESAPLLGQHNEEILCGRLDFARQDLARLARVGVI